MGLYLSDWVFAVTLLIGFSLTALLASFPLRSIFDKLENKE
jgi:hypothetical protein